MNPLHCMRQLLASVLCAAALMTPAYAYSPKEWRFEVLLDNKPIGQHVYRLTHENDNQVVHSQADYNIRMLGFTIYQYQHVATEHWRGGCLTGIESRTQDNGEISTVSGKKHEAEFLLKTSGETTVLAGCVMSFAYWNPDILTKTALLNTQNGEHVSVQVETLGSSPLIISDRQIMATRYRLITRNFSIDLWYGDNNDWLALETEVEGGRVLRYVINSSSYSLHWNNSHA